MATVFKTIEFSGKQYLPTVEQIEDNSLQSLIRIGIIYQYTREKLRCAEHTQPSLELYPPEDWE